ncbi:hypothetical protein Btru_029795, partial [Bulinus truncatus]
MLMELIWPVLIIGIVSVMRSGVPPVKFRDCHYQGRALPSEGIVPFLQSFVCSIDNHCFSKEEFLNAAEVSSRSFSALSQQLSPIFGSNDTMNILTMSNQSTRVFTSLKNMIRDKKLLAGIERMAYINSYFKDETRLKNILVNQFHFLTMNEADALLGSKINIVKLLNLTGYPDLKAVACDPRKLGDYILFSPEASVQNVSASLCAMNESQIAVFSNKIIEQLNISSVLRAIKLIEQVKENFDTNTVLSFVFEDVAQMFDILMNSESAIEVIGNFAGIPNIEELIRKIPSWIKSFGNFHDAMDGIRDIVSSLDPLMVSLKVENSTAWLAVKNIVRMGVNVIELSEGRWNHSSEQFVEPIMDLIRNIEKMSKEDAGKIALAVLEFASEIDWITMYDEIVKTKTLSSRTIISMTIALQEMMEKLPCWPTVKKIAIVVNHAIDMLNIITDKSIELKYAVKRLFDTNEVLVKELNRILEYGPKVIKALLEAFLDHNLLSDLILHGTSYDSVCEKITTRLAKSTDLKDVSADIHNILCADGVTEAFMTLFDSLKLTELKDVINATINDISQLYKGKFFDKPVNFTKTYLGVDQFLKDLESYREISWSEIFRDISDKSINLNQEGWEIVADILTTDFLTQGIFSAYRALGQVLIKSDLSDDAAPYVNMVSHFINLVFDTMVDITESYTPDIPFLKALDLFTSYMPELVSGIDYVWKNNIDAVYDLILAKDSFAEFCGHNFTIKLNLPAYVPVDNMTSLICNTNWTAAVDQVSKPVLNIIDRINQLQDVFTVHTNETYNVETDWVDILSVTEKMLDRFNSGNIKDIDFSFGFKIYFENLNFTRLGSGFEVLFKAFRNMKVKDFEKLANVTLTILDKVDKIYVSNADWRQVKKFIWLFDSFLDMENSIINQFENATNLEDFIRFYPPEVRQVISLLAKAYPEFVTSLKDILLEPTKLIDKFMADGFQAPDCKSSFITDYLLASAESSLHALEKYLCDLDYNKLLDNLEKYQPTMRTFTEKLTQVINGSVSDVSVDWHKLSTKTALFIEQLNSISDSPIFTRSDYDFYPLNFTAIHMSWEDFFKAVKTLDNFDFDKFQAVALKVQELALKVMTNASNSDLTFGIYSYMFVTHHFLQLANTELAIFNASTEIVISKYLWSSELNKLIELLVKSQDINAIAAATVQRLLVSPGDIIIPAHFEDVCSDLNLFSRVFVVEASSLSPSVIQKTVCDLNLNLSLILEQVQNNKPSVKLFIDSMKILSASNVSVDDIQVNMSSITKDYETLSVLIQDIVSHPPNIKLTPNQDWMNLTSYSQAWEKIGLRLQALKIDLYNSSHFVDYELSVLKLLLTTLEKFPATKKAVVYIDGILSLVEKHLELIEEGISIFSNYTNVNRVLGLLTTAPEAIQTILFTVLTEPVKSTRWGEAFRSWNVFCNTSSSEIMTVPPNLNFSMTDFLHEMCSVDVDELVKELKDYEGVNRLQFLFENPEAFYDMNVTVTLGRAHIFLRDLMDYIRKVPKITDKTFVRLANQTLWDEIGFRVRQWSYSSSQIYSTPEKLSGMILEIFQIVFGNLPSEFKHVYEKIMGVTDIVLGQILNILNTTTLSESFNDLPSLHTIANLLEYLPELYETVLYTSIYYPERITSKIPNFKSFEFFCANKPEELLSLAPNSSFNIKNWFQQLCSINITQMVEELENYSVAKDIENIINGTNAETFKISAVIDKMEKIINRFNQGFNITERIFDFDVWAETLTHVKSWIWPYNTITQFLEDLPARWMKGVVAYFESSPGTSNILGYIDAILDLLVHQLDETRNGMLGLQNYTNAKMLVDMIHSTPEVVQTILYTILTEPIKSTRWGEDFQSWTMFCSSDVADIMTVPPSLNFNVSEFKWKMCNINLEELGQEMSQYQGTDKLNELMSGNLSSTYGNSSLVLSKFDRFMNIISDIVDNGVKSDAFGQLVNITLWEQVGNRVKLWSQSSEKIYSDPNNIVGMAFETMEVVFGSTGGKLREVFEKILGITDLVLGQVIDILNSTTLKEAVHDLPSFQIIADLVENLPELFETALYTSIYHPEKITGKASDFTSFETFCSNEPQDIFVLAPNSSLNLKSWFSHFCTINITKLVDDLANYKITKEINKIVNVTHFEPVKMSSVIDKMETILAKFEQGLSIKNRIFDENVWKQVMDHLNTWIWPYNNVIEFMKDVPQRVMKGVLAYFEHMPGSSKVIQYIDVILDIVGNRIEEFHVNLPEAFQEFPTLKTILELVQQSPDIIETVVYTVLTEPVKSARWVSAFQSLSKFCSTNGLDILTPAPYSGFDVEMLVKRICSIQIENIASEFTSYQGFDRLRDIASSNTTIDINTTLVLGKADQVFQSLNYYYDHPLSLVTFNLPIFNESVWKEMGARIEKWSKSSPDIYLHANIISQMFELVFGPFINMSSEVQDAYRKAISVTSILVDEIYLVVNASSFTEAYQNVTILHHLIHLVNQAPEFFETLLYTSMYHPEKVTRRALSLVSFEKFCSVDPLEIFTLPPDSTFNLTGWISELCSLNFTTIEADLSDYKTVKNIENIINGVSVNNVSLTSVVDKMDKLVQLLQNNFKLNDNFLNETLWTQVITKVEKWIQHYTIYDSPLMNFDGIFELIEQLMDSGPGVEAELKPFLYIGVIMDNLLDVMLTLENKTHFGAADFVSGWTTMQKLINIVQMPGVLDVIISSATSEHFLSLLINTSAINDFCSTNTPFSKYLLQSNNVKVDLQLLKDKICEIDFAHFMNTFDNFFDTKKLERVIQGSEKFNWTELQQKVQRVTHLIVDHWMDNPPKFDVPDYLTNASYWTGLFENSIKSLADRLQTKEQIENIIHQLGPLLKMDGFKEIGIVLNSVLDILNENLQAMIGSTFTLGNAIDTIPALRDIFIALGVDHNTMESLLMAPIQNLTKFVELMLSKDIKKDFCSVTKWKQVFYLPNNFNTSGLFLSVCNEDITPLLDRLKQVFSIQTMLDALHDNASHIVDWDHAVDKIFIMVDYIKDLEKNPPKVSSDGTLEMLRVSYTNTSNLWNMLKAFSALHQAFINDSTFTGPFEGIFRVANVLLNYLDEMAARIKVQSGRLDLASLFKDAPEFVNIVNGILDMTPDPLTGLFAVQLKLTAVDKFIDIIQSSSELQQLTCSKTKFLEIFDVRDSGANIQPLLDALCKLDYGPIAEKLRTNFHINTLGDDVMNAWNSREVFDIENFMTKMEDLIDRISNLTQVNYILFNDHDLGNVIRINATRLLEELRKQYSNETNMLTDDYVALSMSMLNSLLKGVSNVTDVKTVTLILKFAQTYLGSFNTFLRSLQDQPILLVSLLNNTEVGKVINPLLTDPHALDGLVHSTVNVKE